MSSHFWLGNILAKMVPWTQTLGSNSGKYVLKTENVLPLTARCVSLGLMSTLEET